MTSGSDLRHTVVPQLSIRVPNVSAKATDWRSTIELARIADAAGVDRLVVSDHIVLGEALAAYGDPTLGGTVGGHQPTGPDGHWLEPLIVLSVVAGVTRRIRLGTAILLAALRPAAVLAKQAATLDVLSGGRLDLGVGVGWQREEYESVGLDFTRRGSALDTCLELCQRLWTEPVINGTYDSVTFDRIHQMPKPLQAGGVPIWVSGRSNDRVVERVARFGTGWIPWGEDATDPAPGIEKIRRAFLEHGRDPQLLQVQGRLPVIERQASSGPHQIDIDATMAGVQSLIDVGISDFRLYRQLGTDLSSEEMLLRELVSAFRETVGRPPA